MRSITSTIILFTVLICLPAKPVIAQVFEDAGQYMSYIGDANAKLTATYLSYMSAIAHKNARKQEKRRQDVVSAIFNTRTTIQGMPPWKGDRSYKDTTVAYLKILNTVFNEDYAKIVNMEEIAEQSYDAMEAYMLAEEKAWEKLNDASNRQQEMGKTFAQKYNVTLIETESEVSRKSKIAGELNKHGNEVYLIFFKPYKQEAYLLDALQKGNLISIEQNINSLQKIASEGMEKLKPMKGYNNDPSMVIACRSALDFFKSEAIQMEKMTDFFLKKENFERVKKNFDAKRSANRTKEDINEYNKAVKEMNDAVKDYNDLNNQLNKERTNMLNNWNKTSDKYMDQYMPVQRKQ